MKTKKCANIVGAGLSGSVAARILAEQGYEINLYEKKGFVSGNLYDEAVEGGIFVQHYGPHFFHTNDDKIVKFINRFDRFVDSEIKSRVDLDGIMTVCPFNFKTIDQLYEYKKATLLKRKIKEEFNGEKITIGAMLKSNDILIKEYAEYLFEHDYKLYTAKQWGINIEDISKEIIDRVPVRLSYIDSYFDDKYKIQPISGYHKFIKNMIRHKNIRLYLNTNGKDLIRISNKDLLFNDLNVDENNILIYTGALDELFNFEFGELPYRSLTFKIERYQKQSFQNEALHIYPKDKSMTRITEFKKLYPENEYYNSKTTVIAKEYPTKYINGENERYYPILTDNSKEQYSLYEAKIKNFKYLLAIGRLANFRYFNMDDAIKNVFIRLESVLGINI